MRVKIKKIFPEVKTPKYAKEGDAGMDLTAITILSNTYEQITYGTGIAIEIPRGYVGLVFPRSSVRKTSLSLSNAVGVIDSGYRGEIQATFNKKELDAVGEPYKVGDRICQIIIMPYPEVEFSVVQELSGTDRGDGGHGSTGN